MSMLTARNIADGTHTPKVTCLLTLHTASCGPAQAIGLTGTKERLFILLLFNGTSALFGLLAPRMKEEVHKPLLYRPILPYRPVIIWILLFWLEQENIILHHCCEKKHKDYNCNYAAVPYTNLTKTGWLAHWTASPNSHMASPQDGTLKNRNKWIFNTKIR